MQLNKVELVNGGIKGLKIAYLEKVRRGSYDYKDEMKGHHIHTPVPAELKNMFYKLKKHLMVICSIDKEILDEGSVIVTGISSNEKDFFEILGYVNGSFGEITLSHEAITVDSGYPAFKKVMDIVSEIFDGVVQYKAAKMLDSNKQMLLSFSEDAKAAKMLENVDIESLSVKEQAAKAKEILESLGGIIMMPEDMEEPEEEKPAKKQPHKLEKVA
jgi:hypothetical protein